MFHLKKNNVHCTVKSYRFCDTTEVRNEVIVKIWLSWLIEDMKSWKQLQNHQNEYIMIVQCIYAFANVLFV